MKSKRYGRIQALLACATGLLLFSGCQSVQYWWQNNRMVGPNYAEPAPLVSDSFSEVDSPEIDPSNVVDPEWWTAFNDPVLNQLVDEVHQQNLSLKSAACRIAEARALRNVAAANLLPQSQTLNGRYAHSQNSLNTATAFPGFPLTVDDWATSFDAAWELDLWGKIRRSIMAADASVDAAVKDYDYLMVTLIGDVASLYVQIRSLDERVALARTNVKLQEGSVDLATKRFDEGRTSKLDVVQAQSNLAATRALIPQLELNRRKAVNALAVLVGIPPTDIESLSEEPGKIPTVPNEIIVGIPAELVVRRPDIRAAERRMAAQFEQIGIAEAELYPTFAVNGTLGWQAASLSDLYDSSSFTGSIAPGFRWNILNYGRLRNNVHAQEARFKSICYEFQNAVLTAQREVEDGIVEFIKAKEQLVFDRQNEQANLEAVQLAQTSYREGKDDAGRVFVVQSSLVIAQDQLVATRANIALALIQTYKALGGGWEIRGQ